MTLYVVRHAFAGEHGDPKYPDDSLRPLTKKGRKQFARMVRALVESDFAPATIGTSPYLRCQQTAESLADELSVKTLIETVEAFAPGCGPDDVIAWAKQAGAGDLAYVGHAPDVDQVTAALLGAAGEAARFAKGAIAAIEFEAEIVAGHGSLRWLVFPKLIDWKR